MAFPDPPLPDHASAAAVAHPQPRPPPAYTKIAYSRNNSFQLLNQSLSDTGSSSSSSSDESRPPQRKQQEEEDYDDDEDDEESHADDGPISIVVTAAATGAVAPGGPQPWMPVTHLGHLAPLASPGSPDPFTSTFGGLAARPAAPWRKLLWVKQPYPDNYVDETFLSQLKQNSHVQPYSFWALSADFSSVLAHLCAVVHFAVVFMGIYSKGWNPAYFAAGSCVATALGYFLLQYYLAAGAAGGAGIRLSMETFKSALLILFTILALSPILKSLTQSTSSDSIWALACWLMIANVFCNDYSSSRAPDDSATTSAPPVPVSPAMAAAAAPPSVSSDFEFKSSLSTNLALSAAIVLASRLPTTMAVFSFVLFSIQIFGVFPTFVKRIRVSRSAAATPAALRYSRTYWALLTLLVVTTYVGLWRVCAGGDFWFKLLVISTWLGIQVSVIVVLPFWLLTLQKYKNEIQGPWDPAKPVLQNKSAF